MPSKVANIAKGAAGVRTEPVETESGYSVRPLVGGDIIKLKRLIADNFDAVRGKLQEAEDKRVQRQAELGPDAKVPIEQGAGMAVAEVLLDQAFDQAWEFLASMIGMTVEAFNEEPWTAHLEVLETIAKEDDLDGFLQRYMGLRRTFSSVLPTSASSDTESTSSS